MSDIVPVAADCSAPRVLSRESLGEPALCLAGGRLVGLVRENGALWYRQARSDDLGETRTFQPSGVGAAARLPSPFITVSCFNCKKLVPAAPVPVNAAPEQMEAIFKEYKCPACKKPVYPPME